MGVVRGAPSLIPLPVLSPRLEDEMASGQGRR